MKAMGLNEIRENFLEFFESKNHLRLQSFSLVPQNDKSLLLINSGMAPMKAFFTGTEEPPSKRVTTCQKCIRTGDIENVGKTARHGTFFEMLGNFSFGDYFKEEIIPWSWEFVTEVLEIPTERLYVTVYENDDEAYEIWNKKIGLPENKIFRMGKADNFWEHGLGPCGPCSEIYYDKGEEYGCENENCTVGCDCDRYMEFWNLVFTQYNKLDEDKYEDLEFPNIDTGMGLERMATIMQDVHSIFDVDTVRVILNEVCKISNKTYNENDKNDASIRLITDHVRSATFMTADGVLPSNEGRGYVLRRLIRRAARHGKLLNVNRTFMSELALKVIEVSKNAYPELEEKKDYILKIISVEEDRFATTLDAGLEMLKSHIERLRGEMQGKGGVTLIGAEAFRLYDTYGFPLDLMEEILEENGIKVDIESFNVQMEEQKERARSAREVSTYMGANDTVYNTLDPKLSTIFEGYEKNETVDAQILYIISDDKIVKEAEKDMEVSIITDRTCMYAESGGQKGDIGIIKTPNAVINIKDCIKVGGNKFAHVGTVVEGVFNVNDKANICYDGKNRKSIARNHTATHLLQKALRDVLGSHVEQAGSMVSSDRLRFDFTHYQGILHDELELVEKMVNEKIFEDLQVNVLIKNIKEAKQMGAMALFGEKYSEEVRVVNIEDYSIEFCGGTHVKNTSDIGFIKIISERGVAAGVRRIEATTGLSAVEFCKEESNKLKFLSALFKSAPEEIVTKAKFYMERAKELNKELDKLKMSSSNNVIDDLLNGKNIINGQNFIGGVISNMDQNGLKNIGDQLKEKVKSGVIVLAGDLEDNVCIIAMVTKDAVDKGVHAGNIIKQIAPIVDGRGGGKPDMAQAGGKNKEKMKEAIEKAKEVLKEQLS